ncbi:pilus assembly protein PilW [Noviherbaspirillum denitrificans]|uniref:Pilus assembly protein PilW n=1 Tax=Noviherbaspirillum denitrificans TaxID=1968433 RepID=A0A254TKD6_9BURK|nr:pilus assembly protein PilW [Noviherbaspirillum denitrificans]
MTLVELMVSMTIGLFLIAAAIVVLVSAKSAYVAQSDSTQVLDMGRHAIDILSRTVRQASYLGWDAVDGAVLAADDGPAVFGMDAKSLKSRTEGVDSPLSKSINGSDVLVVRFGGSGKGSNGDGSVLNCGGFGVGTGEVVGATERGWSIFYVAEDATGEPELYCKYPGEEGWSAQAVARGVESFQVLYGLDSDGDGYPNSIVNATAIEGMATSSSDPYAWWKKVVEVKVAVLVRGGSPVPAELPDASFDLFGEPYSSAHSGRDKGVRIRVSELPKAARNRTRKVFAATIWLRNRPAAK